MAVYCVYLAHNCSLMRVSHDNMTVLFKVRVSLLGVCMCRVQRGRRVTMVATVPPSSQFPWHGGR